MSTTTFLSPDRLYDRPWRPGHPLVRRPSAKRRWTMLALFVVLCALIGGYLFITDSRRVRQMAQSELARIIGGPVTVGRAKLSLFEGLKLERVNVYADDSGDADSLLFSANQFLVSYDPRALLAGRLRLTQIVAIDPHVHLIENLDLPEARWNYQRMLPRPQSSAGNDTRPGPLPALPEVILRNARIDYAEIRSGQQVSRGSMNIEGQFAPSSDGQRYTFELQSRGPGSVVSGEGLPRSAIGPMITGVLVRNTGQVTAQLKDFRFGKDIRSMLPAQVRAWWDRHNLAGEVDIPVFSYAPNAGTETQKYRVETVFQNVDLTIRPEEWMSRDELNAQQWAADAFDVMRQVGLSNQGAVDRLAVLVEPSPIQLQKVGGRFEFTEAGIALREVTGWLESDKLESNKFEIDGEIDGYSPDAPTLIRIKSRRTEIPAQPRYVTSMPRQVRELYDHFRPRGICTLDVSLQRATFGGRLELSGGITIVDGNFVFDRFPYPLRNATGKVIFDYDPRTGMDRVRIADLRGRGIAGGPNQNAIVRVNGVIGPLTADVGVSVAVSADNVHDEPALKAAFPEDVLAALRNLDADGRGEFPTFKGSFECRVERPAGPRSPWIIETDVTLENAAGKPVAFPYFMENVSGKLAIREGYVDILDATMKRDDASLTIGGRVTWRAGAGGKPLDPGEVTGQATPARPDLKITARNVPIDRQLLAALPGDRRAWLEKAGLTGALDIDGRVWRPGAMEIASAPARSAGDSELTHTFDLALHNGTIWPVEGTFAISNINGKMRLLPDRLVISEVTGKRGGADLTGRGEVSWPANQPALFVSGTATRLQLDRTLYGILPRGAQAAWDAVHPEGTVDLDISYNGPVGIASASASAPATQPVSPINNLDLIIHPVKLAATLKAMPYRLNDIDGTIRLQGGKVLLTDLTGRHGDGMIRVSGAGPIDRTDWELRLSGENILADAAFKKALPTALASLAEALKLEGTLDFDFPRLAIRSTRVGEVSLPAPTSPAAATHASTTPSETTPLDVDFHARLALKDASLDVGVAMTQVDGKLELKGNVRDSKLAALDGDLSLASLKLADRSARGIHAELFKPADHDALRIGKITGRLSDGEIAGQVDLAFPEVGPSRYVMNLVLRNADVREVSGLTDQDLSGELSASLALEGDWTDSRSRRGRGDVLVSGKEMYKIPLVLGLLQITNLSLPISAPFSHGSARYSVDGPIITFESLELRSRDMLMSGSGQLDFDSRKVRMAFTTDNPNWPKVPIIGDLVQTAKHELLQFQVKGTLEAPKVSSANTVTTTVDEVLRGEGKK